MIELDFTRNRMQNQGIKSIGSPQALTIPSPCQTCLLFVGGCTLLSELSNHGPISSNDRGTELQTSRCQPYGRNANLPPAHGVGLPLRLKDTCWLNRLVAFSGRGHRVSVTGPEAAAHYSGPNVSSPRRPEWE
jgi:hypothetical protein